MGKELGKSFRWRRKRFEIARQLNFHILCVSIFLFRLAAWIGFMMARLRSIGGCFPYYRSLRSCVAILVLGLPSTALSGPFAESGDPFLRHDLQLLRDTGKIDYSISTWPLSLGGLHANLHSLQLDDSTSRSTAATLARTRAFLEKHKQMGWSPIQTGVGMRSDAPLLRFFLNTPRERREVAISVSWLGNRFAGGLNVQGGFNRASDWRGRTDHTLRFDGSYIATRAGNWSLSLDQLDRWWGPGWDGSLILSNNARPVPALTAQRRVPKPFESRLLNWLGPWNATTFMGRMEDERTEFPHPWLFGARVDFSPTIAPGLEIGLSRTIQWGGKGRPNGVSTFMDALLGQDNVTPGSVDAANEPGNQLAGIDFRYKLPGDTPFAFYGQLTGEDEDKFMPNALMNLYGAEVWGQVQGGSWRAFLEYVDTGTWWWTDDDNIRNVAYNHHLYADGYRHRGRSLGHSVDGDSEASTVGLLYFSDSGRGCGLVLRSGELNRDGNGDSSVSHEKSTDLFSVDFFTRWDASIGQVTLGVGWEDLESSNDGGNEEFTGFLRLTRTF